MNNAEFTAFVEEQIKLAEEILADGKVSKRDDMAEGKLTFFRALHRVLQGKKVSQDLGILDAINDTLQAVEILKSRETLLGRVKPSKPSTP